MCDAQVVTRWTFWSRGMGIAGTCLVLVLAFLLLEGCTAIVTPPENPDDPRTVFLVDATYHAALVLPVDNRRWVRYEFGDWSYFGRNNTGFFHAFAAYTWPTYGAIGRRFVEAEQNGRLDPDRLIGSHVYALQVPGQNVTNLLQELDHPFRTDDRPRYENRLRDLTLVRVDRRYWMFHDSNAQVVDWLEALNCEVHGSSYLSSWRVNRR